MNNLKLSRFECGKVISNKPGKEGKEYAVIKCFLLDVFGNEREFRFFVNYTDIQFLGLNYSDFGINK